MGKSIDRWYDQIHEPEILSDYPCSNCPRETGFLDIRTQKRQKFFRHIVSLSQAYQVGIQKWDVVQVHWDLFRMVYAWVYAIVAFLIMKNKISYSWTNVQFSVGIFDLNMIYTPLKVRCSAHPWLLCCLSIIFNLLEVARFPIVSKSGGVMVSDTDRMVHMTIFIKYRDHPKFGINTRKKSIF